MNIVSYNLIKFQADYKLSNKKMAESLKVTKKKLYLMKQDKYQFNEEEIKKLSQVMFIEEEELKTKMFEKINLKEKKIYGTNYLNLNYEVISYKHHNINLISAIVDLIFFIVLSILLLTSNISLNIAYTPILNILKIIFIVELCVFPFMFIALPLLKIYFNRTYVAVLKSEIKEYYQEEACGIIFSCLRRSINKSMIPYIFTLFSELVIALYCLFTLLYINQIEISYIIMIILFVVSFMISVYSFKYHFGKNGNIVKKEMD